MSQTNDQITEQIKNRRTFAIISHPDAGKTTLTEKFLLYGGAINLAGTVKGRKAAKHAVSDWMEIDPDFLFPSREDLRPERSASCPHCTVPAM